MGYNAELFTRQPWQVDAITVKEDGHTYVRDQKQRVYPFKKGAWPWVLTPGTSYLCLMQFTYASGDKTSYHVHGARPLPLAKLARINAFLYERMKVRDEAGAKIEEDPLFIEVSDWILGTETDTRALRKKHEWEHEALIEEARETGKISPRLPFVAGWQFTLVDLFEEMDVTANEASILPAPRRLSQFARHDA